MAKLSSHGSTLIDAVVPSLGNKYRLMSDGIILVNRGAGWKINDKFFKLAGSAHMDTERACIARTTFYNFVQRLGGSVVTDYIASL